MTTKWVSTVLSFIRLANSLMTQIDNGVSAFTLVTALVTDIVTDENAGGVRVVTL